MTQPTKRSPETIARFILKATERNEPSEHHLDENDLAILDMNAFSESELDSICRHLNACQQCRKSYSQMLTQISSDAQSRRQLFPVMPPLDGAVLPKRNRIV